MCNYIIYLFSKNYLQPFNKEFRKGYKNGWINNIKNYKP